MNLVKCYTENNFDIIFILRLGAFVIKSKTDILRFQLSLFAYYTYQSCE